MAVRESNYSTMIKEFQEAQGADTDNRKAVREADHFLNKRDGQWEPNIISKFTGKPRYTFDECNPIVDDVMGEMESMDFNIKISPSGGNASKETAQQYDGIIRTIENISGARFIYNAAARIMVGTGLCGWRIVNDFRDDDSFQQDILIKPIPNYQDSVWLDPGAIKQDQSDAKEGWILTSMTKKKYDEKYPGRTGISVGDDRDSQVYPYKKAHEVIVGEYLYKRSQRRELALMSDGSVLVIDENFRAVKDELEAGGVKLVRTRRRDIEFVHQQLFDGSGWLKDPQKTPFQYIPVVPVFGNFRISENKIIYWGIVEKLMDPQRVINYAESRKIEEGALAPRGKTWLTKDQMKSTDVRQTLRTMNTNSDPVQAYDHAEGQPPPYYQGSPQSNPGLVETSQSAQNFIQRTSGTFDEARGAAPAHRSGEAVNLLQQKSDNPKRKWFTSMEIAIQHTATIITKAVPYVYDTQQEMVLTGQDGSTDVITIKQKVKDEQSGRIVELNDLSKGSYSVVCTAGPAFHSRQQETVTSIFEMSRLDPSILQLGGDILLNNMSAPGIDKIAARKRLLMVVQGLIPRDQMNKEEIQIHDEISKQDNSTPLDKANLMIAQATAMDIKGKNEERGFKLRLEEQKLQLEKLDMTLKHQLERQKQDSVNQKLLVDSVSAVSQQLKTQAETLKILTESLAPPQLIQRQAREIGQNVTQQ
jgi:hypothetical protein